MLCFEINLTRGHLALVTIVSEVDNLKTSRDLETAHMGNLSSPRGSLSPASELPAYSQGSTKEASADRRGRWDQVIWSNSRKLMSTPQSPIVRSGQGTGN